MINSLQTSTKLYILVFILSIPNIGIGTYGILEMKTMNKNTQTLYADRMLALQQLTQIRYSYITGLLNTVEALKNHRISPLTAINQIIAAEKQINAYWKAYLKTALSPKEYQLVQQTIFLKQQADKAIASLKKKIQSSKLTDTTIDNEMLLVVNPVMVKVNELTQLQINISNKLYKSNEYLYNTTEQKILMLMMLSLLFSAVLIFFIIANTQQYVKKLQLGSRKIKEAEEKYRTFIKYAGDSILIMNQNRQIIDANDSASNLLGYRYEELLNMNISAVIDVENCGDDTSILHEKKVIRKDGSVIDTEMNVRVLEGAGYISIIRDITERKKAQVSIEESEAKYRYLFQNNPAYIMVWDLETLQILEVNDMVINRYGYDATEWNNMSVLMYRPEEDHDKIKDFAQKMLNSNQPVVKKTWRHLRKNGEEILMEIYSHKITYRGRKAILSLANDVTEQVRVATALRKSEEKFYALIDYAADAIFWVDDNGIIFDVNQSATKLLHYTKEELIGKTVIDLHPPDSRHTVPFIWDTLRKEKSLIDERLLQRKDGTSVEVEISRNILPDGSGAIAIVRDITERNIVIRQLKASEERIMRIMQHSPIPLTITLANRTISFTNNQFIKVFGYTLDDIPNADIWWQLAYPNEAYRNYVHQEWKDRIERHIATGMPFEPLEAIIRCKDGTNRYIEFHFVDMGNEFLVNFYDITERKLAEEKLKQSEERHRVLVENISDGILLVNEHWNVVYQSPSVERIVGFTLEDRKGQTVTSYIHPDDIQYFRNQYEKAYKSPNMPIQGKFRARHKDGFYIWLEVFMMNLLHNENVKGYVITYRDITEQKKFEEQQLLMSLIVNSSNDAIISKTLDGIITSWNHGAERILGYSAQESIGQHILMIVPAELEYEEDELLNKIQRGQSVDYFITKRVRKDGTVIDVSTTVSPIKDSLGNVIGCSKILRDISEQKRTQDLLKTQNEKLLEIAKFQSHMVRRPVANVIGLISLLNLDDPAAPTNLKIIPKLEVAAKELDDIIHQIVQKTSEIKTFKS